MYWHYIASVVSDKILWTKGSEVTLGSPSSLWLWPVKLYTTMSAYVQARNLNTYQAVCSNCRYTHLFLGLTVCKLLMPTVLNHCATTVNAQRNSENSVRNIIFAPSKVAHKVQNKSRQSTWAKRKVEICILQTAILETLDKIIHAQTVLCIHAWWHSSMWWSHGSHQNLQIWTHQMAIVTCNCVLARKY